MTLSRGTLAKVDAKLRSELGHDEEIRLVKVPASEAVWSTWRRYCDAVGVPMGRGLAILMHRELASAVDEDLEGLAERLSEREARIVALENGLSEAQESVRVREVEVGVRERRLAEHQEKTPYAPLEKWIPPKRGRNEECWCESGKKFKNCHGKHK
ncbi:MAG: SEC-C metal-binding domain-containing protein [Acidimicrobiia bacterium]|nr:SEC-C metal-binding domain-containing protein [Acidimicrobiia bacterium]